MQYWLLKPSEYILILKLKLKPCVKFKIKQEYGGLSVSPYQCCTVKDYKHGKLHKSALKR